jgi:hypothetical protein
MHTVPLELSVSAAESAACTELVLDQLDRGLLTGGARSRFAIRAAERIFVSRSTECDPKRSQRKSLGAWRP